MSTNPPRTQTGIVLIEVLMAVVIFSLGVLGLISLQANLIKSAGDAKLRTEASYLAGQIISRMWVDRSNLADYIQKPSGSCTAGFSGATASTANVTDWLGTATAKGTVVGTLPNADAQIL